MNKSASNLSAFSLRFLLFECVDEVDSGEEANAFAMLLDGLGAEGRGDVGFASARSPDQNDVVSVFQELAAMKLAHQSLVDLRCW